MDKANLPAVAVLDELIRTLDLDEPKLTRNPLQFFANYIRELLSEDELEGQDSDLYSFRSVISRMEKAQKNLAQAARALELVRNAIRRSQYQDVIRRATVVPAGSLDKAELIELISMLRTASDRSTDDDPTSALAGHELTIALASRLRKSGDSDVMLMLAEAMEGCTGVLFQLERFADALSMSDRLVDTFGESEDVRIQVLVANGLFWKSYVAHQTGDPTTRDAMHNELVRRYRNAQDPRLVREAAYGFMMKCLFADRADEALTQYEAFLEQFPVAFPAIDHFRAMTLVHYAQRLYIEAEVAPTPALYHKAHAIADLVICDYSTDTERGVQVAQARLVRADCLVAIGHKDEALHEYDELISDADDQPSDAVLTIRGEALAHKVFVHASDRRFTEAMQCVAEIMHQHGQDSRVRTALLDNVSRLASASQPPHGIKKFLATVQGMVGR